MTPKSSQLMLHDYKSFADHQGGQYLLKFYALVDVEANGKREAESHMVADLSQPMPSTAEGVEKCHQQKLAAMRFYKVDNDREAQKMP